MCSAWHLMTLKDVDSSSIYIECKSLQGKRITHSKDTIETLILQHGVPKVHSITTQSQTKSSSCFISEQPLIRFPCKLLHSVRIWKQNRFCCHKKLATVIFAWILPRNTVHQLNYALSSFLCPLYLQTDTENRMNQYILTLSIVCMPYLLQIASQ